MSVVYTQSSIDLRGRKGGLQPGKQYLSTEGIDELALEYQTSTQNNWSQERHQTLEKLLRKANSEFYDRLCRMQDCYKLAKENGFEEKAHEHFLRREEEIEKSQPSVVLENPPPPKQKETPRKDWPALWSPKQYNKSPNYNTPTPLSSRPNTSHSNKYGSRASPISTKIQQRHRKLTNNTLPQRFTTNQQSNNTVEFNNNKTNSNNDTHIDTINTNDESNPTTTAVIASSPITRRRSSIMKILTSENSKGITKWSNTLNCLLNPPNLLNSVEANAYINTYGERFIKDLGKRNTLDINSCTITIDEFITFDDKGFKNTDFQFIKRIFLYVSNKKNNEKLTWKQFQKLVSIIWKQSLHERIQLLLNCFDYNYDGIINSTDLYQITKTCHSKVIQDDLFILTNMLSDETTQIKYEDLYEYFKINTSSVITALQRHTMPNFMSSEYISVMDDSMVFCHHLHQNEAINIVNHFLGTTGYINTRDFMSYLETYNIGHSRKYREKLAHSIEDNAGCVNLYFFLLFFVNTLRITFEDKIYLLFNVMDNDSDNMLHPLEIVFLLELLNPRLQGSNKFKELYLKLAEKVQIQLTDVISITALLEILKTPEYSDKFNLTHL